MLSNTLITSSKALRHLQRISANVFTNMRKKQSSC
uniref:Uncharacterized protein n=1 Tax=Arundo donax TaxID=35708 RepID=A0A0A9HKB3_ARUDO